MEDVLTRYVTNLIARIDGPMHFRLLLQPGMALIFAARAGLRDARAGAPPYLLALSGAGRDRRGLLAQAWTDVGKVFIVATLIDLVYQLVTVRWIYPLETLTVAVILAFIPYMLARGLCARIARRMQRATPAPPDRRAA